MPKPQPYGLIISLACLSSILIIIWQAKKQKQNLNVFLDSLSWVLISGLIGARVYHVIHLWSFYKQSPLSVLQFWQGGLGIYGGILGGILGLFIYSKLNNILIPARPSGGSNFLNLADLYSFGLPLAQAIGRWANFINQELYGYPTNLPWAIYIKPENKLAGFENYSHFHPLFLYESLWSFMIFIILLVLAKFISRSSRTKVRYYKKPGVLFFLYLFLYSIGRFFLEFLKPDPWKIFNIPTAQLISLIIIITSLCFSYKVFYKGVSLHDCKDTPC